MAQEVRTKEGMAVIVPMLDGPLVLLHGLMRTSRSMQPIAERAQALGMCPYNWDYPSRNGSVDTHARALGARIAREIDPGDPISFVTHSLGGIVVRTAVALGVLPAARIKRAVFLAPPNNGTNVVDRLAKHPVLRMLASDVGMELGSQGELVRSLPPVDFPLGVIAGTKSVNPVFGSVLQAPHDGTVSVADARVAGMADFLEVPSTHTFIMYAADVQMQIFHFLRYGAFYRSEDAAAR